MHSRVNCNEIEDTWKARQYESIHGIIHLPKIHSRASRARPHTPDDERLHVWSAAAQRTARREHGHAANVQPLDIKSAIRLATVTTTSELPFILYCFSCGRRLHQGHLQGENRRHTAERESDSQPAQQRNVAKGVGDSALDVSYNRDIEAVQKLAAVDGHEDTDPLPA